MNLLAILQSPIGNALQDAFMLLVTGYLIPGLVTVVGTYFALVLLPKANAFLKAHLSETQLRQASTIIKILVLNAEQSGLKDEILKAGSAKKAWVVSEAQKELDRLGLTRISSSQIDQIIEASVFEFLNSQPKLKVSELRAQSWSALNVPDRN